jgi:hypothetical protein
VSHSIPLPAATLHGQRKRKSTHLELVHSSPKCQQPVLQSQDACRYIGEIVQELEELASHFGRGELAAVLHMAVVATDLEIVLTGTQ